MIITLYWYNMFIMDHIKKKKKPYILSISRKKTKNNKMTNKISHYAPKSYVLAAIIYVFLLHVHKYHVRMKRDKTDNFI